MAYKKYTVKNGRTYGPYFYENKRVGDKVVTTYLGKAHQKKDHSFFFAIGIVIFLMLIFFLFGNFFGSPTGKSVLSIDDIYEKGELIEGVLILELNGKEFIPAESSLKVNYNGIEKNLLLSEVVGTEKKLGSFYFENGNLSGGGEGYGLNIFSETISFDLRIKSSALEGVGESGGESGESNDNNESVEINTPEKNESLSEGLFDGDNNESEESHENNSGDFEMPADSGSNNNEETEMSDGENTDSGNEDMPADSNENTGSENSGESTSGEDSSSNGESGDVAVTSENSEDSGALEGGDVESSPITGAVILENEKIVSGTVVNGTSFEYILDEGESVELVDESVRINGVKTEPDFLNIKTENGKVIVELDEEFIQEQKYTLEISLEIFNLTAEQEGDIEVALIYGSETLVNENKHINVVDFSTNETIFNETLTNETLFNETVVNETIANFTNVSVATVQYQAVLGQPVKWKKIVNATSPVALTVEIPLEAENIVVTEIAKSAEEIVAKNELLELENGTSTEIIEGGEETSNGSVGISGEINGAGISEATATITGEVVFFDEDNSEYSLQWFEKIIKNLKITGFAVSNETDETQKVFVEINESEKGAEIEYETPAPYAVESETADGKSVTIVGPESIHYENILAYTNIPEYLNVKNSETVKIFWKEENSFVAPLTVNDVDGNGVYDYVEWVVPHLSNQTFDIIVVVKAEHLNENRTFVSDIYDDVKSLDNIWSETIPHSHFVRVTFETKLTRGNDITIYPRVVNGSPIINIYENNGNEIVATFSEVVNDSYNKVFLENLLGEQDVFDLQVLNGDVQFDHIVDPNAVPNISFVAPTPDNGSVENVNAIYVNVSSADESAHYAFLDFDNDVLLWMRFDDVNSSNDPIDLSKYGHNGSLLNGATYNTSGMWNQSAEFDNTDDSVLIPHTGILEPGGTAFTVSTWARPRWTQTDAGTHFIYDKRGGSANLYSYRFFFAPAVDDWRLRMSTADNTINCDTSGVTINSNQWYHFVTRYNGTGAAIFIDGAHSVSCALTGAMTKTGTYDLHIGGNGDDTFTFGGSIDDFIIFNRSLTDAEILTLYNASANKYYNNFTGLSYSTHKFKAHAVDSLGKRNSTELRTVTLSSGESVLPAVAFGTGTPENNSAQSSQYIYVNLTSSDASPHYSFVDFNNDLSFWMRMDDLNSSNDPTDLSKYSNNGSKAGNAVQNESGVFGESFAFDGNGDYITVQDSSVLDLASNFSISMWMKPSTSGVRTSVNPFGKGSSVADSNYILYYDETFDTVRFYANASGTFTPISGQGSVTAGSWNHVVLSFNNSGGQLYVNSAAAGSLTAADTVLTTNSQPLSIGKSINGDSNAFNGTIDEFLIFNRSLTATEIGALYNASAMQYTNNFTASQSNVRYYITGHAVDAYGNKNKTTREVVYQGSQIVISDTKNCSQFNSHVKNLLQGYDNGAVGYDISTALNFDLNVTSAGQLNLDSECAIFFNNTAEGARALYLSGVLNFSGGKFDSTTANNFNFSVYGDESRIRGYGGELSDANILLQTNITDEALGFSGVHVKNLLILLNHTISGSSTNLIVDSGGEVRSLYRLNATVKDDAGANIPGVNVSAWNVSGAQAFSLLTDSNGAVFYNLTSYVKTTSGTSYWSNYTISHNKTGYYPANLTSLNLTQDTNLALVLETFDTIIVSGSDTLHSIYTRVNDPTIFVNLSDGTRPCRYAANADINVTTGTLRLESCTLEMNNTASDGENNLYLSSAGTLVSNYSNITKTGTFKYDFKAFTGSTVSINNSYVSYTGSTATLSNRGFYINTSNVYIQNSSFSKGYESDIEIASGNIDIGGIRLLGNEGSGTATEYNVFCVYCSNVTIKDSNISGSDLAQIVILDNQSLNLLNTNYSTYNLQPGASLYYQWYVDVFVNNSLGNRLADTLIKFYNNSGSLTTSSTTNGSGIAPDMRVTEYIVNSSGTKIYQSNYTVNASKAAYPEFTQQFNLTTNSEIHIVLTNNPVPLVTANSPSNNTQFVLDILNITLNASVTDYYGDSVEFDIYGVNSSNTGNIYRDGLLFRTFNLSLGSKLDEIYNWTSPVITADNSTVLLMHFDNRSAYGENNNYVRDFSQYSNNGTIVNNLNVTLYSGKFGGAVLYNGKVPPIIGETTDYVSIPYSSSLYVIKNYSNFSFFVWMNYTNVTSANKPFFSQEDGSGTGRSWFSITQNGTLQVFLGSAGGSGVSISSSVSAGVWHLVGFTYNGTSVQSYVDGTASGSAVVSGIDEGASGNFRVGVSKGGTTEFEGFIDELVIYNRTLNADEVKDMYRLKAGTYYWKANATDSFGNSNESALLQFTINAAVTNSAPTNPTPEINSSDGSNKTLQNLNCFDIVADPDGDSLNVSVEWFNNSISALKFDYNNSYANGSLFNAVLTYQNTTKNQNWSCALRFHDGELASSWVNSTNLTILNSVPTISQDSPADAITTTNRTPLFNWTYSDDDGDTLTFNINITCRALAGGGCGGGNDDRFVTGITNNYHIPPTDLQYLWDNGFYYLWQVLANDSEQSSDWTGTRKINITALVSINLLNDSIDFGNIDLGAWNDTSDNSPLPLLLENNGNAKVNVTLNATNLWTTVNNPSSYYQFKIDNYTSELNSFNQNYTLTSYTNTPNTSTALLSIALFNYLNTNDTAEIDINVTVPLNEPPGSRSSTIILEASLTE